MQHLCNNSETTLATSRQRHRIINVIGLITLIHSQTHTHTYTYTLLLAVLTIRRESPTNHPEEEDQEEAAKQLNKN